MADLPKIYDPKAVEEKWYRFWSEKDYFHPVPGKNKKPFTIMMPPPNVTGILHMGHALQSTIQDALIRYHRMRGYDALWMPGTDHAGIATQNVVEKMLRERGTSRKAIGREAFVEEVWKWKKKHGNIISDQQKKLGSSCDWKRERFTMDEGLSQAVRKVFVTLYEQGLIYKGKYIVNWCPFHMTALSDEEVKHVESQGSLWYIKYFLDGSDESITVATTRPETMLGDTAVAVNPKDKRYKKFIGKKIKLPILDRKLPVIADDFVDRKFGTGAVKVTPAHDANDFLMGQRHKLPNVIVIDEAGKMTSEAGPLFAGLDRFECRKKLVAELDKQGFLEKTEDYTNKVGKCYRCSNTIEPLLSDQWFLKMAPLAEKASKAVKDGEIVFYPKKWEKDFQFWMDNIRDWCISRQLWWGHRLPVWYCGSCGEITVSTEDPTKCSHCDSTDIRQDEDVLDTWFSSWLWPFSTLDWPKKTKDLDYFYPTSVLVSGYEILFFWIARMIMAGLWFTGEKPFSVVYLTGMIKDEQGRIMSKSLGNGIDPVEMVDLYGADSVRYCMIALNTDGQDIKLSQQKFEMGRNFTNKIWNAFRFLKIKESEVKAKGVEVSGSFESRDLSDRWLVSRLNSTRNIVDKKFSDYKLNEALNALYTFVWHDYCDWYLEILKDRMDTDFESASQSLLNVGLPVFKKTMELLHPFMPFITEEIWQLISPDENESVMITSPGEFSKELVDAESEKEMGLVQDIIYSVRNIRGEMNIPPAEKANLLIKCSDKNQLEIINRNLDYLYRLGRINKIDTGPSLDKPPQSATAVVSGMEIYVPLADLIDINSEHDRLSKEVTRLQNQIITVNQKISNKDFLGKAPAHVIEREREKLKTFTNNMNTIQNNLNSLELS